MKIQNIFFKNFKQFDQMNIRCRDTNILVGPNNAGKSTLLDGIRICNDVLRYSARKNPTLESQGQHGVCATHHIEHSKFCINILHCVRNYGDEDAEIIFTHENSNELHILIHPSKAVRAFIKADGKTIRNSTQFRQAFPLEIIIVPTLGPFESEEDYVTDETVNRNENTRLAHRSFRNIIYRKTEGEFSLFKTLASRAWPNVELNFPERGVYPDKNVKMFFLKIGCQEKSQLRDLGFRFGCS